MQDPFLRVRSLDRRGIVLRWLLEGSKTDCLLVEAAFQWVAHAFLHGKRMAETDKRLGPMATALVRVIAERHAGGQHHFEPEGYAMHGSILRRLELDHPGERFWKRTMQVKVNQHCDIGKHGMGAVFEP